MNLKRLIINCSVTLVTFLLLLGLSECVLRLHDAGAARKADARLADELALTVKTHHIGDATFNIYYFGGSTMAGEPYAPLFSIPRAVSYMLGYAINGKRIRVINIAQPDADLAFNLKRMAIILQQKDVFYPGLCVVYSGHNEFSRYAGWYGFGEKRKFTSGLVGYFYQNSFFAREVLRRVIKNELILYRLEIDERHFFDQPLFSKNKYAQVIALYKSGMHDLLRLSHKYKVPCIISTVVGNYAGWDPNRSIFWGKDADKQAFEQFVKSGKEAQSRFAFDQAAEYFRMALALCGSFAEAHYLLGRCYEGLGKNELAWDEYGKAVAFDGMPMRATEDQNNFIRKIPEDTLVGIVDPVASLRKSARGGLIGFNFIIDAHHPNLSGYLGISRLIAEKIKQMFGLPQEIRLLDEQAAKQVFTIDRGALFEVAMSRGRWFSRLATWRYDPSVRLHRARECFMEAMRLDPARYEPYLGLAICDFLQKNTKEAESNLARAKQINAREVKSYLAEYWISQIIKRAYQGTDAR